MDKSDDDHNGERKFCICRDTYDENRPMVGCDKKHMMKISQWSVGITVIVDII